MALSHPGWAVFVVLLVAATGPVAAAQIAPAHETPTAGPDPKFSAAGTAFDDDTINDTTDNETVDTTTDDTVDETVDTNTTETSTSVETTATDGTNTTTTATTTTSVTDDTDTTTTTVTTDTVETNTTGDATETANETANETLDDATSSTGTLESSTETVDNTTASSIEGATDAVDSTTDDLDSSNLTQSDNTLTNTTLTDTSTLDDSTDVIDETEETTDDVESVLTGDGAESLELGSENDSTLLTLNAAASSGSDDDSTDGGTGGADGPGGGDGASEVDAETSVAVESSDQLRDSVESGIGALWQTVNGFVPEDAPVGPVGATGVGALAVLAVASRQWFVQSAGSGMPTLLSSGLPGSTGDWVEKLKRLAVPLRYSRYDDSDPLEHDTRRVLNDAIEANPGINLTTLAEQTDVPLSTARHHVRVLADERLVTTAKRHGKRRYYPMGVDDVALSDALSEPPKAAVLHALADHGEAHVGLLADELDRDPSTITHHLQALADDSLVEREKRGRTVVNRLTDTAEATLCGDDHARADYAELPADD